MENKAVHDTKIRGEAAGRPAAPYPTQAGNPPVRISFQPRGASLAQRLKTYFLGLKL